MLLERDGEKLNDNHKMGIGIAQWIAYLLPTQPAWVRITAPEFFSDSDVAVLIDCVRCLDSGQCKNLDNS